MELGTGGGGGSVRAHGAEELQHQVARAAQWDLGAGQGHLSGSRCPEAQGKEHPLGSLKSTCSLGPSLKYCCQRCPRPQLSLGLQSPHQALYQHTTQSGFTDKSHATS